MQHDIQSCTISGYYMWLFLFYVILLTAKIIRAGPSILHILQKLSLKTFDLCVFEYTDKEYVYILFSNDYYFVLLFDLHWDSIWLDVWDGLIKRFFRYEMSHVLQKFTIKHLFTVFLVYVIYLMFSSDRKGVFNFSFNCISK